MNELFDAPSYADQQKAWSNPPIDDVGYLPSKELMKLPDEELKALVEQMEVTRYTGYRNWNGHWRDVLGLDSTTGKSVLDYGCGVGVEALQYARAGNNVYLGDISIDNLSLATRVFDLFGYPVAGLWKIPSKPDKRIYTQPHDVIHCSGVLHHIPEPRPVVERMAQMLKPDGELRLMLYSDEAWRISTGTEPPEDDVSRYVEFETFVRHWDGVGDWADWYDKRKLMDLVGDLFSLSRFRPLTSDGAFVGAVLVKR